MYYDSICFEGGHAFVVGNSLQDIKYWWNACLQDGISYNLLCFPERHVLLEVMFYLGIL